MGNLYRLALRNLWVRKARTLLTLSRVALGVAFVLAVGITNAQRALGAFFPQTSGRANLTISNAATGLPSASFTSRSTLCHLSHPVCWEYNTPSSARFGSTRRGRRPVQIPEWEPTLTSSVKLLCGSFRSFDPHAQANRPRVATRAGGLTRRRINP